jgi:hypothetical protein
MALVARELVEVLGSRRNVRIDRDGSTRLARDRRGCCLRAPARGNPDDTTDADEHGRGYGKDEAMAKTVRVAVHSGRS